MSPALGDAEEQTACFFPRRTPRRTPDFPHGRTAAVRPSQRIPAPRRLRPPSAELAPTPRLPRHPPAPPPAPLSRPQDAAPRLSPALSPPRPGQTRRHRALRCVTPTDGRTGCPGSGRYLRAVLQSLFQEELVDARHVGAAARRSPGRSGVRSSGTPRRRGSAASVCPSLPPSVRRRGGSRGALQAPSTAGRLRWRGQGRSLRPVPVGRRKRVTGRASGGRLPAAITLAGSGRRAQMEGGSWRPPAAPLPESRVARRGMQQRPWMPPQLREAVRAQGCDNNQGKISSSRLSSCGLGSSAVGEPSAVLSSGARQGHFWHQHSRLLISDPPCGICVCSCPWTALQVKLWDLVLETGKSQQHHNTITLGGWKGCILSY